MSVSSCESARLVAQRKRLFERMAFLLILLASTLSAPSGAEQATTPGTTVVATTPTVGATAPKDDGLIDFNLNKQNIDNVVQFISEHTGKPVVKKSKVSAEITIATPKRIPPSQAVDLLYDALLLEGFAVIETEDRIQIVPVDEVTQQDIMTVTGEMPEALLSQKSRVIRRVILLKHAKVSAIKPYIEPMLGKYAAVTADERTNKLIITDIVRNIERYEAILKELDILGFDQLQVRVIPLAHGEAVEVAKILSNFAAGLGGPKAPAAQKKPAKPGRPNPQKGDKGKAAAPAGPTIIVLPDRRTNSIVIAAPSDRIQRLLDLLERLDVSEPRQVDSHVIWVEHADAGEIARAVARLFRRTGSKAKKDIVEVLDTARENAVLVLASDENYALIESIVRSLDTEDAQQRESRRYELKHVDAADTAQELGQLYGTLQDNSRGYFSYYSSRRQTDTKEAKFVPVPRANALLVLAPPNEFKLIEELIAELDQPVETEEALPKIYYIRNANAKDVETVLNEVFAGESDQSLSFWERYYGSGGGDDKGLVGRLSGKIKFFADENTNSIIAITNNQSNYDIVDKMIAKLDVAMPGLANTMIHPLDHADAEDLANTLNTLFGKPVKVDKKDEEADQRSFYAWWGEGKKDDDRPISNLIEKVRFVADTRTNSLLVTAAAHHFPVIRDLIQRLDKDEPQVLVRVRILEVQRGKGIQIGLRWTPDPTIYRQEDLDNAIRAVSGLQFLESFGGQTLGESIDVNSQAIPNNAYTQSLTPRNGIISGLVNMDLLLQLLLKNLNSSIRIQPDLYMSNNRTANIFVGEQVPRVKSSTTTPQGGSTSQFEDEPVGVTMEITPHINQTGVVMLKVKLETSQLTGESRFGSDIIQERQYNTEVAINGGETMVLGGIRLNSQHKIVRKFPILGQIPILGMLFRSYDIENRITDLYAFITPMVVFNDAEAQALSKDIQGSVEEFKDMLEAPRPEEDEGDS